ncbi:transcription factor IIA [Heterostelium album PN500]|uniref:Transcription factor IIA n=1 Tax=Heterostelium pallidum (strain ATCC 26659 / Pp 5 / PN500) TaxID=670386 RepID=D3B937_HETP5|nr:transcription factor IIA [Heterostelium album PN500]EFA82076.1 transcription factor IIA [Heterostelium album PN500]|eukprot:XP_020434193.1 transcription factor IIA [Heterostelium album PN500]
MSVTSVYRYIIDDVIRNIRIEFVNEGLEDRIIAELQHMWESRLMQSGAVQEPTPPPSTTSTTTTAGTPVANISTAATTAANKDSSPTSTSTSNSPPNNNNSSSTTTTNTTPSSDITPEHVRSTLNTLRQFNNIPGAPITTTTTTTTTTNAPPPSAAANNNNNLPSNFGRPSQFMPPTRESGGLPHMELPAPGSSHSLRSIMNIPQNDGSSEEPPQHTKEYIDNLVLQKIKDRKQDIECSFSINIPQLDGNDDELDDDSLLEEHRPDNNNNNSNIESLGSDLDDDEDNDPDPVIEHFVLCQYEKVTRVKNKRKCNFKDGVMHLNGRDSLFHKANAEFVWK